MDLFEYIRTLLGCEYISDIRLPENRTLARRTFSEMNLSGYSQREIDDMKEYLGISRCKKEKTTGETSKAPSLAQ